MGRATDVSEYPTFTRFMGLVFKLEPLFSVGLGVEQIKQNVIMALLLSAFTHFGKFVESDEYLNIWVIDTYH